MTVTIRPYKRGGWEADIVLTFPGRPKFRERRKAPVKSKSAAKRWGEERERQIIQRFNETDPSEDGKIDAPDLAKKEVPTLKAFIPRYMTGYCEANRQRKSTRSRKQSAFRAHLIPKLGHKRLNRITAEDVQQLKASLDYMSTPGANTIIKLLRAVLNVAVEWEVIPAVPVKIKPLRESEPELEFYDYSDYARLVCAAKALDPRIHAVTLLGGDAGLRRGEIIALEWSDIDLARGRLTIARSEYRGVVTSTKGHRARTVPLSDELAGALRKLPIRGKRVLYSCGTKTPVESTIRNWLGKAQVEAGFKIKGPHTLRHTFCSHLAMSGAPARAIQKLAGHRSVVTTERYMHLSQVALDESIRLLNRRPAWRHDGDDDKPPIVLQ